MQTYDPHRNTVEVRQADRRRMNLHALVLGTVGLLVAFAIVFAIYVLAPEGNVIS